MPASTTLETLRDSSRFGLEETVRSIQRRDAMEQSGQAYVVAAMCHRRLAFCALLVDARPHAFFHHLCHSAHARHHFLRLVADGHGADPRFLCATREFPFIDALAAGQLDLAVSLARLAARKHEPTLEYEDDFLLYHFLHQYCLKLKGVGASDLSAILKRWDVVLEGGSDTYLEMCRALLAHEVSAFDEALQATIDARLLKFSRLTRDSGPNDELRKTEGALFMNGLALLRLAEMQGLETRREYVTIPSLARLPLGMPPPPTSAWMETESHHS
ncbi:immunity 49 family protein [Myxococcus qinghaiensis]|uniref:immunity 49 family protein n=1 Tax=Myxococcus qinghaiensis TaxID=2906758 RepID=UPI0020A7DFAD|nr:immunity 49 family protein [Myxococcus qinghaiensis]MCP3168888.1 immunity 49 family protein [Myxococcus qinghaiensis]